MITKIISGGQRGADVSGNFFALNHNIPTEANINAGFKIAHAMIPVNVVSQKTGTAGLVERRRYNISNSDITIVLIRGFSPHTPGSVGTVNDCFHAEKPFIILNVLDTKASAENLELRFPKDPVCVNIAGQRDLSEGDTLMFLNEVLEKWIK